MLTKESQIPATISETEDEGIFHAVAAAWTTDREGERFVPGCFEASIRRWLDSGSSVPLLWSHGRDAVDIIGTVTELEETDAGLEIEAEVDIATSEVAAEAWRSLRERRIGLSVGFLIEDARTGEDGAKEILAADLAEISVTSIPANADTRILSAKSLQPLRVASFEI
jgi:Escherichia/Staphylococcus phage prohead protease